jgi:hypothetical protein
MNVRNIIKNIWNKFKTVKKTIIICLVCFIFGCLCTITVAHRYNKSVMRQDSNTVQQYRANAKQLNDTIDGLQKQLIKQSDINRQLAANNNAAIAGLSESFKNISNTNDSIRNIKQAVSAIRKACQILANNGNNCSSGNGGCNDDNNNDSSAIK